MKAERTRRRLVLAGITVALILVAVAVWTFDRTEPPVVPPEEPEDPRPTAAVSLGDSFASGEAAGSYERAADGSEDRCHRSSAAQIHMSEVAGIDHTVNLACSGARTRNIRLDGEGQHGDPPQAEQLRAVALDYNIELVVLTVGANDLGWGDLMYDCATALLPTVPDCREAWGPRLAERTEVVGQRIEQVVADIRTVMRETSQTRDAYDEDYDLVLQSYAAPVPRDPKDLSLVDQLTTGCPLPPAAMAWTYEQVMPLLAGMVAGAAESTGARFLDLSHAFDGHQVCAKGTTPDTRWVAGLVLDPQMLSARLFGQEVDTSRLREAMHPNARGHAQLGRCLTRFVATDQQRAACREVGDGKARVG